jgi:probable phosphoglycerate mutase
VRHGETEWSHAGKHTGLTDLPLTEAGQQRARALGGLLGARQFTRVLTSPLLRARETSRLAGYGEVAEIEENLREWDYGDDEGRTTAEIRQERPGWSVWNSGPRNGESIQAIGERARAVIRRVDAIDGDVAVFAHGHMLRVLAACWIELPPQDGRLLAFGTGSVSVLGYERETRVIVRWNVPCL